MGITEKFCIFCGEEPENKNKEHVLPQWLIELTGDPKRVVNFGRNPVTGDIPRFDWSSLVFPSCKRCNDRYSSLENNVKGLVIKLVAREPIRATEYVHVFDWLDKVRIGLWLGYSYLHKNPMRTSPTFHIDSRIGQKDRMIAIYTLDTKPEGLNAHGAETLCFQLQPSCFSLKVNNIYILNMSWDYMCSARCGFPFPKTVIVDLDADNQYKFQCSDYAITHKVKNPVMRKTFIKPSIHLYQPIIESPFSIADFADDEWLRKKIVPGSDRKGVVHRQWDDRVEVIENPASTIENDEVTGHHTRLLGEIVAQTYDLQLKTYLTFEFRSKNKERMTEKKKWDKLVRQQNNIFKNAFLEAANPKDL